MDINLVPEVKLIQQIIIEQNIKIIVMTGPSGAGKTELTRCLTDMRPIFEIVSCTSRKPRLEDNEVEGIDYYFKTHKYVSDLIKSGKVIEYSNYTVGDLYCISTEEMLSKIKKGKTLVCIADINGVTHLKKLFGDAVIPIFIFTNPKTLADRLIKRGDNPNKIIQRLTKLAQDNELDNYKYADYAILNNNFEMSKVQLFAIVDSIMNK